MGLGYVRKVKALTDFDLYSAGCDDGEQGCGRLVQFLGCRHIVEQGGAGDKKRPATGETQGFHRRSRTRGVAEADQKAPASQAGQAGFKGGRANGIVDHRNTLAPGYFAHARRYILARGQDDLSAVIEAKRRLGRGGD